MDYLESFKRLVERAPAFRGKAVELVIIANPAAGGFTITKRAAENKKFFFDVLEWVMANPVVVKSCDARLHLTAHAGHAREIAETVADEMLSPDYRADLTLVVTAGGDGTSHEVQTAFADRMLLSGHPELSDRLCFLRLPFGTGNDGSDGRFLSESLELLTSEVEIKKNPVVCIRRSESAETKYAFNIASVGLDAFVATLTNQLKSKFPGDVYKLMIDAACLFYNRMYKVGAMDVRASLKGTPLWAERAKWLMVIMGASGHRTYGSNQKILPGESNVCCVHEMSLLAKLSLKELFKSGRHSGNEKAVMLTADRLVLGYDSKLLMQLDGEAITLQAADFPVVMELSEPCLPVLKVKSV